jgi:ABC-type Zn uptake system ZnuABC Zn-binding protein ZnuA
MKCIVTACVAGALAVIPAAFAQTPNEKPARINVLAAETFLADIAQNVAGDRLRVESMMPFGVDPHDFEPAPSDVRKVAECQVLIVNGGGLEAFQERLLKNAGGEHLVIDASKGLTSRNAREGEVAETSDAPDRGDPHFWLDPNNVMRYVENIRDGLIRADPDGKVVYARNAETYTSELKKLDAWIKEQAARVPAERRVLVTSHDCFGYFADRYGFKIIGTIIPSVSTDAQPSARQIAELVDRIRALHAPAVFVEAQTNTQLAEQVGRETGVKVVSDLYLESTTDKDGPAPTYLKMMRHSVSRIVETLVSSAPK